MFVSGFLTSILCETSVKQQNEFGPDHDLIDSPTFDYWIIDSFQKYFIDPNQKWILYWIL